MMHILNGETYPDWHCTPSYEKVISLSFDKKEAKDTNNLIKCDGCHDGNAKSLRITDSNT